MNARWSRAIVVLAHALWIGGMAKWNEAHAEGAGFDEEIVVIAPTPATTGLGIAPNRLPFSTQSADSDALERAQSLDLTDYLNANLASVSVNAAQNNPLQPDVQFRGFSASPLLGLPMGISVYQNGIRINEPLGDAVNWDLIPESAIHSMTLVGGANPLFGLNTLGGALSIDMKDGFNTRGNRLEISGGSWGRAVMSAESGGNNGTLGYYANVRYFDEAGWRDLSPSDAANFYGELSWRGERGALDLNLQYADTHLRGNGPSPAGQLALDRAAVFTAPDITDNTLHAISLDGDYKLTDALDLTANGFYRKVKTGSFNGDASSFVRCALKNRRVLLEDLPGDALSTLGLNRADVCTNNAFGVADVPALQTALNAAAGSSTAFDLVDLTPGLSGTGILADAAINNRSSRIQEAYGTDAQLVFDRMLGQHKNYFVAGFSYYRGNADFDSRVELANLDPLTRSTEGLGVSTFVDREGTSVTTHSDTWSLYFMDNFMVTEQLTLTVGGRYNESAIALRDRSGVRPELDGDHDFSRFNPTAGVTYTLLKDLNIYANYSESARAPTPIELACNDGVFEIARRLAAARGEDPTHVNFACRLPNAFLADPPLKQVVAESVEGGVRGVVADIDYRLGYFRTVNKDDIIFQSTGRTTGLFANVDATKREGMELALAGTWQSVEWFTAYSYVNASFESAFKAHSPHHPDADANGEIQVSPGARIPGIPRHQLKMGGDYTLPVGIKVGLEMLYNSDQVLRGDESNQLDTVAGYAVVNLRGSYRFNAHLEAFARVTNVFDEDYETFGLLGEDPTAVLPNLRDPTAQYLGAGAPRGGWIGVRLSF